ncbi:enolase C-terminal domain-like protein [Lacrimispora sp.]|uniref:enolase C-terminal domain-like protein n=1 Tax=Lacrimispora sp. TaxID=2719234 RepID=UPI0032E3B894
MKITTFETWWISRDKCLFDKKRQGGASMNWDVLAIRISTDTGHQGIATCLAARSGAVSEAYLYDNIAPVIMGRDPHDREAIWHELWNIDRHLTFFPVYLPGPIDVALWDLCAKEAGLPLYQYIGAYRKKLPVYASGNFHAAVEEYVEEALHYKALGIPGYKAHPAGPAAFDMEVHKALREAVGPSYVLMSDPVAEYTMGDAVAVGRQLEQLGYKWLEEPFRDFELYKYTELCRTLDIPVAATETTRGAHWGVAQAIAQRSADIVRADVSWKDGVTGTLKIAHLAEAFGINCEIHTTTMNYMDLVNLHVSCAIRNCEYFEYFVPEENYQLPMKGKLPIENGIITVPDLPGVGADLDWELIEKSCRSYQKMELE